jgi:hypothetical protein
MRKRNQIVIIFGVALIGSYLLVTSHASTPYVSNETESGTLSGAAAIISSIGASGNKAVQFGTASSTSVGGNGCSYGGAEAPCVGSATTGASGWSAPVFDDEFSGTSLNTNTWNEENGYKKNGITVSSNDETVSSGNLVLTLSSTSTGAEISTNSYELPVGGFAEARIDFPGNGTNIYNWPAWWTAGPGWPTSGEQDILEGDGAASINYHYQTPGCTITNTNDCDSQRGAYNVPGDWANAFHTYGLYRGNGYVEFYYDGTSVDKYNLASTDDGGGENLILTNGCYSGCSVGAQVKVDYVRAWQ